MKSWAVILSFLLLPLISRANPVGFKTINSRNAWTVSFTNLQDLQKWYCKTESGKSLYEGSPYKSTAKHDQACAVIQHAILAFRKNRICSEVLVDIENSGGDYAELSGNLSKLADGKLNIKYEERRYKYFAESNKWFRIVDIVCEKTRSKSSAEKKYARCVNNPAFFGASRGGSNNAIQRSCIKVIRKMTDIDIDIDTGLRRLTRSALLDKIKKLLEISVRSKKNTKITVEIKISHTNLTCSIDQENSVDRPRAQLSCFVPKSIKVDMEEVQKIAASWIYHEYSQNGGARVGISELKAHSKWFLQLTFSASTEEAIEFLYSYLS